MLGLSSEGKTAGQRIWCVPIGHAQVLCESDPKLFSFVQAVPPFVASSPCGLSFLRLILFGSF